MLTMYLIHHVYSEYTHREILKIKHLGSNPVVVLISVGLSKTLIAFDGLKFTKQFSH